MPMVVQNPYLDILSNAAPAPLNKTVRNPTCIQLHAHATENNRFPVPLKTIRLRVYSVLILYTVLISAREI